MFMLVVEMCPDPGQVLNATLSGKISFVYKATIKYECHPGFYVQSGDLVRYCNATGSWTGKKPFCKGKV